MYDEKTMKSKKKKISGIISFRLIIAVFAAFVVTSLVTYSVLFQNCVKRANDLLSLACTLAKADMEEGIFYYLGEDVALKELEDYLTQGEEAVADYLKDNEYTYFAHKDGTIFLAGDDAFLGKSIMDIQYAPAFIDDLYDQLEEEPDFTESPVPVKTLDGKCDLTYFYAIDPSYPDVVLAAAFSEEDFNYDISKKSVNRFIGQTGYTILVDSDGTILNPYASWDIQGDQFPAPDILEMYDKGTGGKIEDEPFEITVGSVVINDNDRLLYDRAVLWGTDYFLCMTRFYGTYIISLLPAKEALSQANTTIRDIVIMDIIVFTVLFIILIRLVKLTVVDKIKKVNTSLDRIAGGDLEGSVEVRDSLEFDVLSNDINTTVDKLKEYIAEAAARIDADLAIAKEIQTSSLPNTFPPFPGRKEFELFATMEAAKEVGGDFYDFYMLDDNTLGFLIADVSGKSIPGAMFMMRGKSVIKSLAESGLSPNEVFTRANEKLCEGNDADMFITAWLGYLDLRSGRVKVANAGHNPPVLIHGSKAEYVKTEPNLMLAIMEGLVYKEETLQLQEGDILYLYTDGVTEAMDANEDQYGEDRLKELLSFGDDHPEPSGVNGIAGTVCEMVKADIERFTKGAEQSDDITMLCIRYCSI